MVEQHIRPRGIVDQRVLQTMATVPRHHFVGADSLDMAYCDRPLPLRYGQTISQPYIVAYMTEAATIGPEAIVLEIGTGSGYQTAILAQLAKTVYTVERIPELAHQARQVLDQLDYTNIQTQIGDGYQGWATHAPYDAIVVTAAPPVVPDALVEQLAINGRLVIPVGDRHQEILVLTKTTTGMVTEKKIPVRFVPMIKQN
ncbi:MAG: protein-L-isoaspartate(D-aspartate) O-methyltransferase [Merismopedia sp. SIO2A8]|nr:protein-L-isoaspartate(D-aspartate) O-methyltransferase [Merismopedia sp. SIO2A8]